MAKVCGTSEEARQLGSILNQAMSAVGTGVDSIEKAGNSIRSAWNDDGADVVDELVSSIRNSLKEAQESMPAIQQAIEAYAQFLERR